MSQYFENNDNLKDAPREITCWCGNRKLVFRTDSGVFSRTEIDDASLFMVRNIGPLSGTILDLGCGYGFVGIYCAVSNPDVNVLFSDVNKRALELCKNNCTLNGINGEWFISDGFSAFERMEFDSILLNPPIHAGKNVVHQLICEGMNHLSDGGKLYIVIREKHGAKSLLKYINSSYSGECIKKQDSIWLIVVSA